MAGSYEHSNEPTGAIKCWEFPDFMTVSFSERTLLSQFVWVV